MKVIEIKPHDKEPNLSNYKNVFTTFLAGTIDNGDSYDWQHEYVEEMHQIAKNVTYYRKNDEGYNVNDDVIIIYNPRRDNWSTEYNYAEMDYQIKWELEHLDKSDNIYMNLLADSKSPISLMELGLYASTNKLHVICPKEFYRYDNVRVVCDKYKIPFKHTKTEQWSITV